MNNSCLVSIGLPSFNRAQDLKHAIESVLTQSYTNLEIIISDNASTDDTQQLCEEFAAQDKRIRYIRQAVNRGPAANFATVLDGARGEFFMWLGDDDWIDQDYVRECVGVLTANADFQLACGCARYYRGGSFLFEEEPINLWQDDPAERVLGYFRQVNTNGMFYGVTRRGVLATLEMPNGIGGDWLAIGQLAFIGKSRTLESVHVNRSLGGASQQDVRTVMVSTYGLPAAFARMPFVIVAWKVFADLAWKSHIYKPLKRGKRLSLATKSAKSIIRRFKLFGRLEKIIEIPRKMGKFIAGLFARLQTKLILRTRIKRSVRKAGPSRPGK